MIRPVLQQGLSELAELLPKLADLEPQLQRLAEAMMACWDRRGKVLIAGNGGSAADAMHFAEELVVRFEKNRRGLAAVALTDPTVLTCAGNDLGFERVFARQVEALGNAGDLLIVLTTSGNSLNLLRAVEAARQGGMVTAGLLGKDGGALRGQCDVELLVPSTSTARIQEAHKLLYHTLCRWIDMQVD
jgi:D-sedoheptulose 7-phosphate isomerase